MPIEDNHSKIFNDARLIALFIVLVVLAVYWPVIHHDFVAWDDDINVYENPHLNPATGESFAHFWKAPYLRMYIPLTYSIWAATAWWGRRRLGPAAELPTGNFHALNLIAHILAALAAFALLRQLLRAAGSNEPSQAPDKRKNQPARPLPTVAWAAGLGAAFFALHPLQVEPVAWVSGLRDVLSGLAGLGALQQYAAFETSRGKTRLLHYGLATTALLTALLSKPSAVVIPFMACALARGVFRRPASRILGALGLWLAIAVAFALLTQKSQAAAHIRALLPLWARPLLAADSLAFYLAKLVFPAALSPDYGRAADVAMAQGWIYWTWMAPAAVAVGIWRSAQPRIGAVCAGLFFLATWPVLGFVPFLHQDLSTVADRYVYLAMIAPALALAWVLTKSGSRRWPWAAAAVALTALAVRSRTQAAIWNNTGTLFSHIVALNPDSGVAHLNLGNYLNSQGKLQEAEFHFRQTLRLRPGDGLAYNNLGNLQAQQGRVQAAIESFNQALRSGVPDNIITAHNALGVILAGQGKLDEAQRHYSEALRLNPQHKKIHNNMAMLLAKRGRLDEARFHFAQGLGVDSGSLSAYATLCDFLQVNNLFGPASGCYRKVVAMAPLLADGRNSLGFVLSRLGRELEAMLQFQEALRLKPDHRQALFNLGVAHHNLGIRLLSLGKNEEAVNHFQKALGLQPGFEPSRKILSALGK
ncbi:MAG: hypothetical protein A3J74_00010 [Elusimicrobia bacterium RIFCSPHIGHO2_02_FULL_57_9]|nr:MAG: hypothetical protein A3J74_00010 [Elusimicrobia bacterium RIFCSPHIGHO2_02_FULL_57_9]